VAVTPIYRSSTAYWSTRGETANSVEHTTSDKNPSRYGRR
jgi:hypothetical protein